MIPLTLTATIEVKGEFDTFIDILNVSENNYKCSLYTIDDSIQYEVDIYNFNGHPLELVGKVIDGWSVHRKN